MIDSPAVKRLRIGIVVALAALPGLVWAESLAELATKEKERRKSGSLTSTKVLTNEDLTNTKGQLANEPTALPAAPYVAPSSAVGGIDSRETYWRAEAARRRETVARLGEAVRRTDRWADPTYAAKDAPSCPITRRRLRRSLRQQLDQAQQSLVSIDEEARKAGIPPGWVRE